MKAFRTLVFWLHLITGLTVGVVVLVMSVTGVLLTYERQMLQWADTRGLDGASPTAGAARLDVATLVTRATDAVKRSPTAITWRAASDAPVEIAFGRERSVFVNAYTGEVLGDGSQGAHMLFQKITDWHRVLGAAGPTRARGKAITGVANLGFLFIVVSGLYLWWPRHWTRRTLRNATVFRRGLRSKARDFNWHNVIGLWSWAPLVIVVASGVVLSYSWANRLVYRSVGEQPSAAGPPPGTKDGRASSAAALSMDSLVARAALRVPEWRSISLTLPTSPSAPMVFQIDGGTGGQPQKRVELALDRVTGREVRWQSFATLTPGRRLRAIFRFAHTGEVLGVVGQTVAGLASFGAVFLVYTGLALSWRRLLSWRRRRQRFAADGHLRGPTAVRARL
ncbi:MAG: PepSY-associated TM helix domain-containing protein [bacterium]